MGVEMNYIIDSLAECISEEKVCSQNLSTTTNIIRIACETIRDSIGEYDANSRIKIMNDLASIIGKNRFASILVYSRFKSIPGLNGINTLVRQRMLSIAGSGGIRAFYEWFIDKNIDNDMSDGINSYCNYVKAAICDKIDHCYDLSMEVYSNALRSARTIYPGMDTMLQDIREFVEADMIEYIDLIYLIGQFDDAAGEKAPDLIRDTDDLLSGIMYMTVNSLVKYILTGDTDTLLIEHIQKAGRQYCAVVNEYTGCMSQDEINAFVEQLTKTCIDTCIKSMFRRVIEKMANVVMNDIADLEIRAMFATRLLIIVAEL